MGELQHEAFQSTFNGFLKVAFQGSRITSDAGLILVRELDERLGLATLIAEHVSDSRQGLNTQFSLADLLRQSVYSRLAGYEDLNDAVRVSADPTFRLIGSPKLWDRGAALTSTLHWFETELLTREENLVGLMAVNREVLAQAEMATRADRIVLDMDSSESPVHGAQEGSAYNGHFDSVCYHPLFLFNEHGDCVAATLRPGNVHSADDWDDLLVPEIGVYPGFPTLFWGLSVFFVGDLMGKALWKLVENAARFPRRGGRVLCVHGAVSFHRARPCGPRWLPGRGAMRDVELDRRVLGLQSTGEYLCSRQNRRPVQAERSIDPGKTGISGTYAIWETRI